MPQILADLETALRAADTTGRIPILPLIFDSTQATDRTTPEADSASHRSKKKAVVCEARTTLGTAKTPPPPPPLSRLGSQTPTRRCPTSAPSAPTPTPTTPRSPLSSRAPPQAGAMLDISKEIVENRDRPRPAENEDSFVFPLVLAGRLAGVAGAEGACEEGTLLAGDGRAEG